jgi:hypothetical protein
MDLRITTTARLTGLGILACLLAASTPKVAAQPFWPYGPPTSPMAQNNAMHGVLNQVKFCQNSTRASSYMTGYGNLVRQFQEIRNQYAGFKATLTPGQAGYAANEFAELNAGLDIIQEAFGDYEAAVGNGQAPSRAFNNLKQVLNRALPVWAQQFRRVCSELRIG